MTTAVSPGVIFFVVFFSFPWSGHTENDGGLPRGGADVGSYPRGRLLIKI